MKKTFFLVFLLFCASVSWGQNVVLKHNFNNHDIKYNYEVRDNVLKPERKTISVRRLGTHDSQNDIVTNTEVFHSMIRLFDRYKKTGMVHIRIYYAEPQSYQWEPNVKNYMEAVFNIKRKEIFYKTRGAKMRANNNKQPLKHTSFEPKDTKKMDMVKIAVEYFILHYDGLFLKL